MKHTWLLYLVDSSGLGVIGQISGQTIIPPVKINTNN